MKRFLDSLWSLGMINTFKSQAGFAPILVLFLLIVAVIGGTYLVQQRTNFLPFAVLDTQPAQKLTEPMKCEDGGAPSNCLGVPSCTRGTDVCRTGYMTPPSVCPSDYTPSGGECVRYICSPGFKLEGTTCNRNYVNECPRVGDITTICTEGRVYSYECTGTTDGNKKVARPSLTRDAKPGDSCYEAPAQPVQPEKCHITYQGTFYERVPGNSFTTNCEYVDYLKTGRQTVFTCQSNGLYSSESRNCNASPPSKEDPCDWTGERVNCIKGQAPAAMVQTCTNGIPSESEKKSRPDKCGEAPPANVTITGCSPDKTQKIYSNGSAIECDAGLQCGKNVSGSYDCVTIPGVTPPRSSGSGSSGAGQGGTGTAAPSDPETCKAEKTCIYSQGADECYIGVCKSGNCGFNSPDCSFQNALDKSCVNTTYSHSNGGYSVSGTPGSKVNCPTSPVQGGTSGSTTSASSGNSGQQGSTGATPTPTPIPLTTREQLYEKCGFIPKGGSNIPLFAVGLGENQEITDEMCKKLQSEQLDNFNSYIEKARAEEEELRKRAEEARKNGDTAKAEELTKTADELKKKTEEAEKKTAECKGKSGQQGIDCLKAAQEPVKQVATEAQSAAVKNALAKYEKIIKGEIKGGCVKADLGITPYLEAQRLKRRSPNDEQRRVLLCAGDNDPKQLKWRVLVGGKSSEEATDEAEKKKLTSDDGDDIDEGNNAERIWGLHGKSKDATGDPTYPYDTSQDSPRNALIFGNPNTEEGRNVTMGKYVEAAKAGKNTLRSAPVPGDDGVEAPCSKGATNCGKTGGGTTPGGGGQQPGGGGSSSECTPAEKDRCAKEGSDYVCTKPNGQYSCAIADKCKEDKDCSGKPDGKTECHRSSGQCIKPKDQSGGGSGDECQDTNQCLSKNGDGWICNSSKKCENEGGDSCTSNDYCSNKYDNERYWCKNNRCTDESTQRPPFQVIYDFFGDLL